ncbi:MAG TPA: nuclear transport factor 2 family protein [Pyrinomonadaceae bacterium]|nr:nuclear transport factor 2 family protein [Pyrinomonadaceae bacterium]
MDDVSEVIKNTNLKFAEIFKRGDAAGVAALYTPDARLMPPDVPLMTGTEAITAFWQAAMKQGIKAATLESIDVETSGGDLATEIGRFKLAMKVAGADDLVEQTGKYIVLWKLDGGTWKLHADIWNADAPAGRG